MNNIQKIIEELKADFSKAKEEILECHRLKKENELKIHYGYAKAFEKHIHNLTLLLNAETQATVKKPEA